MLTLRRSTYVLAATFIALLSAYLYSTRFGPDWLKDVSLNVGTEVLGILLTVMLIDAVIRRKDQTERDRVVKVAFAQLRIGLQQHIGVLQSMYKASISHPPKPNRSHWTNSLARTTLFKSHSSTFLNPPL